MLPKLTIILIWYILSSYFILGVFKPKEMSNLFPGFYFCKQKMQTTK